jgi:dihydrofolate synthase/folylpolyglutamate synthase
LSGLDISVRQLSSGIKKAQLAGRFEQRVIANKTVIFDAGHNPHGVEFLLKQLRNSGIQ